MTQYGPGTVIYKRTNTGAVQIWQQELNSTGDGYRTISGQKGGAQTTSAWTMCGGKNETRANATSGQQQALSELMSNYTKKLAQGGYKLSESEIDNASFFEPMLAHPAEKYPLTSFADIFSQPKLDGGRAIIQAGGAWTRQGKPLYTVPHVLKALQPIFAEYPTLILDGELYNHDIRVNDPEGFNKIVSLMKKQKPDAKELAEAEALLQYHYYDVAILGVPFTERMEVLSALAGYFAGHASLKAVPTVKLSGKAQADELYGQYMTAGYEGQMFRVGSAHYQVGSRTKFLLKRKEFQDAEFIIVDVLEGVGNRSGMAGMLEFRTPAGRRFTAGIKGGFGFYRDLLARRDYFIGKPATVKFFEITPDGSPRFPVCTSVRDYE